MWNWHDLKLALLHLCFVHSCEWCTCVSLWLLMSSDAAAPLNSLAGITTTLSSPVLSITVPDQLLHTCRLRPVIFTGQEAPYGIDVFYSHGIRTPEAYAVMNCRLDYLWLRHGWLTSHLRCLLTGQCHLPGPEVLKQGNRGFVVTTEQLVHFNRSLRRSEVRQYLRLFLLFCLLFLLLPSYF